ncbi:TIR domain-containing protein [Desulfobulbus sp.]|uniref:TIR domain-containing protein n=1 Tax=Desulfobulbus sp. TaxID=895 RepID=UPI00359FEB14
MEIKKVTDNKVIFVAFAIEDERQRDFLKGQSLHTNSPFEYVDMSVKDPYDSNWKDRVRTRIRRSDGVIALVSKNSLSSSGQKWEIQCAREEKKRVIGIWVYKDDRTNLVEVNTVVWTWAAIEKFIDSL